MNDDGRRMQAVQKIRPAFGLELRDVPEPSSPLPHEVILSVAATGVCGTDLHIYEWTPGYEAMTARMPVTLGHEFSGVVARVGPDVRGLEVGTLVAVRPSVVCGVCAACSRGHADDCEKRTGIGITRDGALASVVRVPAENCVAVPHGLDPCIAALAEPMTVSAESIATGEVRAGSRVLILGPGNIGQGAALFAREAGAAKIVVAGRHDAPRLGVLQKLGFTDLVDVGDTPLHSALAPHLAGGRFDVVIEATGAPAIVQPALDVLRTRGILVVVGIHAKPATIDLTRLVRAQQQIRGSYRAPRATWPAVIAFLGRNASLVDAMITHRLPLHRAIEGIELSRTREASKVVIVP